MRAEFSRILVAPPLEVASPSPPSPHVSFSSRCAGILPLKRPRKDGNFVSFSEYHSWECLLLEDQSFDKLSSCCGVLMTESCPFHPDCFVLLPCHFSRFSRGGGRVVSQSGLPLTLECIPALPYSSDRLPAALKKKKNSAPKERFVYKDSFCGKSLNEFYCGLVGRMVNLGQGSRDLKGFIRHCYTHTLARGETSKS